MSTQKASYYMPKKPGDPIRVLRMFEADGLRRRKVRLNSGSEGKFVKMEEVGMPSIDLIDQMGLGAYDTPRFIATFPEGPVYLEEADFQFKYVERPMDEKNLFRGVPGATPEEQKARRDEIMNLRRIDQRYAMTRTSKLMARQEAILKKYLEAAGSRAVDLYDELPANVQAALRAVKDQETLWSDVDRWFSDNKPSPHRRWATQGDPDMSLYRQIHRVAMEHPETRKFLVPEIRRYASECAEAEDVMADGDELLGGRTWGNPDPHAKPDDNVPYRHWEDSPPAGADGSAQRKKYNEWYRENVCPSKHKTNCGAPWLAK